MVTMDPKFSPPTHLPAHLRHQWTKRTRQCQHCQVAYTWTEAELACPARVEEQGLPKVPLP